MAERRMFTKTIIDSDAFLDMSTSAQALYFHLGMRADDDGFINNPRKIMKVIGACEDDFKLLVAKRFVLTFQSGIIVIKHWRMHNLIQKDRYKPTVYMDELASLTLNKNKSYTDCIQNGNSSVPQVSIGKVSIGKVSIGKDNKNIVVHPFKEIIEYLNSKLNTQYKHSSTKTQDLITARFNQGFTYDDFITVIDKKYNEWYNTDMAKFLRPETLFSNKFEGYLNQIDTTEPEPKSKYTEYKG
jgi:uncharacterized phage protein (TIGR02220 family)